MTDISIAQLAERVSIYFGVRPDEIFSKSRKRKLVFARAILYFYLHLNGFTYHRIGQAFNRNHATIIHGAKYANRYLVEDYQKIFHA